MSQEQHMVLYMQAQLNLQTPLVSFHLQISVMLVTYM